MSRTVVAAQLESPPEVVWKHLAALEEHHRWMSDADAVEFLGESRRGPGTRMLVPTRVGPFRTNDVLEVVGWDEGRSITVIHRGVVTGEGELSVVPDGSGSRVTWAEELRFPWWLGGPIGELVAGPVLRRVWQKNLERLARIVAG